MSDQVLDAVSSGSMDPEDARWQSAIADELRAERARHRISSEDLAGRAGVTATSMRRYLSSERTVPWRVLAVLCDAFGVSVADLVARAETRLRDQ